MMTTIIVSEDWEQSDMIRCLRLHNSWWVLLLLENWVIKLHT